MSEHGFPNFSDLQFKQSHHSTTTSQATTWEQRDLAKTHLSRPPSSTTINLFNSLSICIFPKKQGLEEKSRIVTFCNRVDTEIERRTDRIRRRCTIQNIVRIRQLAAESKHHHSFT